MFGLIVKVTHVKRMQILFIRTFSEAEILYDSQFRSFMGLYFRIFGPVKS